MDISIASSLGIGSGINTRTLVRDLAANARELRESQIVTRERSNGLRISVVAQLKSSLEALATDYADSAGTTAPADLKKLVTSFVSGFNLLRGSLADAARAGSASVEAGPLSGDSSARAVGYSLGRLPQAGLATSGTYRTLSDIGIGVTRGGTLALDSAKFDAALAAQPAEVAAMLTGATGLSKALKDLSASTSASDGALGSATLRYERIGKGIARDRVRMEDDNSKLVERLTKSFGGMDRQVAQLNAVKAYLEQQVAAWNSSK
jgi:flagellar hook-associated protein 2